jgi:hypothetical protein
LLGVEVSTSAAAHRKPDRRLGLGQPLDDVIVELGAEGPRVQRMPEIRVERAAKKDLKRIGLRSRTLEPGHGGGQATVTGWATTAP